MIGAIIGDIVGSRFEFSNYRAKDFELWGKQCDFTDDSVMTVAVAKAVMNYQGFGSLADLVAKEMHRMGKAYPGRGYGGRFAGWLHSSDPKPYGSFGNGSAMRVSAVSWVARSLGGCIDMARQTAECTHNHPEGIKGAEATAVAGYLALHGATKQQIRDTIEANYYPLNFAIDGIRKTYRFNETCQDTVPQAIEAFLESESFEDCLRIAISVGGDSDTLAAIACGIAECYYGVPNEMRSEAMSFLDDHMQSVIKTFEQKYGKKVED